MHVVKIGSDSQTLVPVSDPKLRAKPKSPDWTEEH
jgi:hypothetical protein